jgi:hypothetical protein
MELNLSLAMRGRSFSAQDHLQRPGWSISKETKIIRCIACCDPLAPTNTPSRHTDEDPYNSKRKLRTNPACELDHKHGHAAVKISFIRQILEQLIL